MCNYTAWGSIFLFIATYCEVKFHSTILWMVFYAAGIICFLLANRQENALFKRIRQLETQIRAISSKNL